MLQNPDRAFRDPQLRRCSVEMDAMKQPRPWSGSFAVVYKGILGAGDSGNVEAQGMKAQSRLSTSLFDISGSSVRHSPGSREFAIRVFTTRSPQRQERYDLISEYLKSRRLKCLVDFHYTDPGIRSAGDGKWYPLVIMEWVRGQTLLDWVRAMCREGNRRVLAEVAEKWVQTVKELADASIAHGDLQHGNVMITDGGQLKLVDYDGMCVPSLVGRRNLEVGVAPYQHPTRNENTRLSLELDNFSALVIYVALRALSLDPGLWRQHVERMGYDKLLFRPEDFQAPAQSPLLDDLMKLPDPDLRELVERLVHFAAAEAHEVASLGQVTNPYVKVEELLRQEQWEAAVKMLNRRGRFRDAPKHLEPLIQRAYEHVCRKEAQVALDAVPRQLSENNDRRLATAWNEDLLSGYEPAERQRPRVTKARQRLALLDRLRHLLQQSSAGITLAGQQAVVELAGRLPDGYQYGLAGHVEVSRRRVEIVEALDKALSEAADEAAIAQIWQRVVEARCDGLVSLEVRERSQLARKRVAVLEALDEIAPRLPLDQLDRQILQIWREDLLADCHQADPWRLVYETAVHRKDVLARLESAINCPDEAAVVQCVEEPCLAGYPLPSRWDAAIAAIKERVGRTESMIMILEEGRQSSFLQNFDARIIRQYPDRFAPHQPRLSTWTRSEILPSESLGLATAVGRASLLCVEDGDDRVAYRVRWTWPQQRFSERCLLAVCRDAPGVDDEPGQVHAYRRFPIDRAAFESGGGSRLIHAEPSWDGGYVVVWAVVDLGFQTFHSHPLVLGRLQHGQRQPGRKWKFPDLFPFLHS